MFMYTLYTHNATNLVKIFVVESTVPDFPRFWLGQQENASARFLRGFLEETKK